MRHTKALAAAALLMLLGGCNRDGASEDGLSGKDRQDLDNAAALVEDNQIFDTSADSLVLEEDAANRASEVSNLGNSAANEAAAQ